MALPALSGFFNRFPEYTWRRITTYDKVLVTGPINWGVVKSFNQHFLERTGALEKKDIYTYKAISSKQNKLFYVTVPISLAQQISKIDQYMTFSLPSKDSQHQLAVRNAQRLATFTQNCPNFKNEDPLLIHPVIALNRRRETDSEVVQKKLTSKFKEYQKSNSDEIYYNWNEHYSNPNERTRVPDFKTENFVATINNGIVITGAVASSIGRRDVMEDACCHRVLGLDLEDQATQIPYFGVFDGHSFPKGDKGYALKASTELPAILHNTLQGLPVNASLKSQEIFIWNAIKTSFVDTSEALYSKFRRQGDDWQNVEGGTTALLSFIFNNHLFVANAGDCRAILVTEDRHIPLSRDAKPIHLLEKESPPKTSSSVYNRGSFVSLKEGFPTCGIGLATTRSLGHPMIQEDGNAAGINPRPEICKYDLAQIRDQQNVFLVLASDGLWDAASSWQVANTIRERAQEGDSCEMIASYLTKKAFLAIGEDNIMVMVIELTPRRQSCCTIL